MQRDDKKPTPQDIKELDALPPGKFMELFKALGAEWWDKFDPEALIKLSQTNKEIRGLEKLWAEMLKKYFPTWQTYTSDKSLYAQFAKLYAKHFGKVLIDQKFFDNAVTKDQKEILIDLKALKDKGMNSEAYTEANSFFMAAMLGNADALPDNKLTYMNGLKDAQGFSLLHWAARNGRINVFKKLLNINEKNPQMDEAHKKLLTVATVKGDGLKDPLTLLMEHERLDMIKILVAAGFKFGSYAIGDAAGYGRLEILKYLLASDGEKKIDVIDSVKSLVLYSALEKAINNGHLEVVKYLIASVNVTQDNVFRAVRRENLEILKHLLAQKGMNAFSQDEQGNALLHDAVSSKNIKIIDYLLKEQKVNPNIKNNTGSFPLHFALNTRKATLTNFFSGSKEDQKSVDIVYLLIANKADVNAKDKAGYTVLHYALIAGYSNITQALLLQGHADLNTVNLQKETYKILDSYRKIKGDKYAQSAAISLYESSLLFKKAEALMNSSKTPDHKAAEEIYMQAYKKTPAFFSAYADLVLTETPARFKNPSTLQQFASMSIVKGAVDKKTEAALAQLNIKASPTIHNKELIAKLPLFAPILMYRLRLSKQNLSAKSTEMVKQIFDLESLQGPEIFKEVNLSALKDANKAEFLKSMDEYISNNDPSYLDKFFIQYSDVKADLNKFMDDALKDPAKIFNLIKLNFTVISNTYKDDPKLSEMKKILQQVCAYARIFIDNANATIDKSIHIQPNDSLKDRLKKVVKQFNPKSQLGLFSSSLQNVATHRKAIDTYLDQIEEDMSKTDKKYSENYFKQMLEMLSYHAQECVKAIEKIDPENKSRIQVWQASYAQVNELLKYTTEKFLPTSTQENMNKPGH